MNEHESQTAVMPVPRPVLGTLGRYVLRQELASGGMATVYLAHLSGPHGFEKAVALKQIHPHLAKDRRFVEMFLDEARVAALIHHPNVCTLVDFGEEKGVPYLVLEYLNGEPMSSVVDAANASGDAPVWLFARIVHDAARGLHAAHQLAGPDGRTLGVVHRDVSPHNIFVLYDGLTKVVDFGVARARGRLSVTQSNEVKGKLPYMSPEQFENRAVDHRTDIWALGVVLWESTLGRRLFRGNSDAATIAAVLHKPVPRPSDFAPDYPPALEAMVMRCLERDVERRFDTAEQLADALEEYLYSLGRPVGASQVKRWMHEHFDAEIAHRAALLRGESPAPLPSRHTATTAISSRPAAPAQVATLTGSDDAATAFVRRPRTSDSSDETPLETPAPSREAVSENVPVRSPIAEMATEPAIEHAPVRAPAGVEKRSDAVTDESTRRMRVPPALALLLATLVGVGLYLGLRATPPTSTSTSTSATPTVPSHAERVEAPPVAPPVARTVEATPSPAPAIVAPTETEPQPPALADAGMPSETSPSPRVRSSSTNPRTVTAIGRGRINLMAVPSARVRIDGRSVGETPLLDYSIAAGEHRVELVTADGRRRVLVLRVTAGELTRQSVRF